MLWLPLSYNSFVQVSMDHKHTCLKGTALYPHFDPQEMSSSANLSLYYLIYAFMLNSGLVNLKNFNNALLCMGDLILILHT